MKYIREITIHGDYFAEFRIFCCFDEGRLVVLFNGFQKKTQKTPSQEIKKATAIMNEYFNSKKKGTER